MKKENKEQTNGLFQTPMNQLVDKSWELLLRKKSENGNIETTVRLNPSEEVIKELKAIGVFN